MSEDTNNTGKLSKQLRQLLWLTIGLGSLICGGKLFFLSGGGSLNAFGQCLIACSVGSLFIMALMAIVSAYRRSTTAVFWSIVYFIAIILLGLACYADPGNSKDLVMHKSMRLNEIILLWGGLGLFVIYFSDLYQKEFPEDTRQKSWVAIGLLIIYTLSLAYITVNVYFRGLN